MTAGDSCDIGRVDLGALYLGDGQCQFRVWAPNAGAEVVQLQCDGREPVSMTAGQNGYHGLRLDDIAPGTRYRYILSGGNARPDPASRFQPEGAHIS